MRAFILKRIRKNLWLYFNRYEHGETKGFSNKVKELLLCTAELKLIQKDFNRMKKKKIGRMLRSMNSLEYIASKYMIIMNWK